MTPNTNSHVRWTSAATPGQGDLSPQDSRKNPKSRRMIPFEKIHQWAKESHDGGRGQCFWCKDHFSMNYLRRAKVTAFRTEFACGKCRHEKNLQIVK